MKRSRGFSLIEMMVVISIISLLSSIALTSLGQAKEKAKIGRAKADLVQLRNALALLEADTGKWPLGCPPYNVINPEIQILPGIGSVSGIFVEPPVKVTYWTPYVAPYIYNPATDTIICEWTQAEADAWNGPYMFTPLDPWGNAYWFDTDYPAYSNRIAASISCPGQNDSTNAYGCPQDPYKNDDQCDYSNHPRDVALFSRGPIFSSNANADAGLYSCTQVFLTLVDN